MSLSRFDFGERQASNSDVGAVKFINENNELLSGDICDVYGGLCQVFDQRLLGFSIYAVHLNVNNRHDNLLVIFYSALHI
jgi:hypothetical protein